MTNLPPAQLPPPAAPTQRHAALARGWLRGLLRGIRMEGVRPRDPRVKALWRLLYRRQLLARNEWLKTTLRYVWQQGLARKSRPRTARRIWTQLREWGVLTSKSPLRYVTGRAPGPALAMRPMRRLRPVALRRVATAQPMRPVRPMRSAPAMRPVQPQRPVQRQRWRSRGR